MRGIIKDEKGFIVKVHYEDEDGKGEIYFVRDSCGRKIAEFYVTVIPGEKDIISGSYYAEKECENEFFEIMISENLFLNQRGTVVKFGRDTFPRTV